MPDWDVLETVPVLARSTVRCTCISESEALAPVRSTLGSKVPTKVPEPVGIIFVAGTMAVW